MLGISSVTLEQWIVAAVPTTLGMRATVRMLRVARTLADCDGRMAISGEDLAQAWTWQAEGSAKERGEDQCM
jgi:predicted ATPase with chaperone activity